MRGKRMTVFIGERDQWKHRSLYLAILEHLKARDCAGATVTRGIAGFGASSQIRTAALVDVIVDLPVVITVVDSADKIDQVAPEVAAMLSAGTIAIEDAEVHFTSAAFRGGIPDVRVADVMTRDPDVVAPESPVVEVVRRLLERDHTVLPVVDRSGKVIGVVGDHDLVAAGVTPVSLSLHKVIDASTVAETLRELATTGRTVQEIMTTPAVTIRASASLPEAAHLMHERSLKRLPVVDDDDRLVGVLGRLDILSSVARGYSRRTAPPTQRLPQEHRRVAEIMDRDVPTVLETTPLGDVVERLLGSDVKRVVVTDSDGRLVGIIADTDMLARVDAEARPGLWTTLRSRWNAEADRQVRRVHGQRAADVMSSPAIAVRSDSPVIQALTLCVSHHLKRLPVVDADGRIVGIVSRPALLAASLDLAADARR